MSRTERLASRLGGAAVATVVYALFVPWLLRPWFLAADRLPHVPGPAGVMIDSDLYLNIWILAWLAHAAVHAPSQLFDGNIYHPAAGTILGSENMLAHLPVTAPVLAWTGDALTMLKAYLVETFALSGLGMFLFVRHHTRSFAAALVAGACFSFTAFRVQTIPQPQYLGIAFLPLSFLFIDLWLERRRIGFLAGLTAALALQALSCVYVGFFTFVVAPVYAAVQLAAAAAGSRSADGAGSSPRPAAAAGGLLGAIALAGLVVLPLALPYARARAGGVIPEHGLGWIRHFSWSPVDYVSAAFVERAGAVAIALVLADLAARGAARLRRRPARVWGAERALWAVAAVALVLSAGPAISLPGGLDVPTPYRLFYELVPGFSSLRTPLRFSLVVAAALAALAGFAFARWGARLGRASAVAAAAALVLAAAVAAAPRPAPVMAAGLGDAAPPVYRWLARHKAPGTIVEIPAAAIEDDVIGNERNGRYMVASTLHWRPLVNGYTAYPPPLAGLLAAAVRELPDPAALALLVDVSDLRWVLVHRDLLHPREAARWPEDAQLPGLVHVGRFGPTDVYDVRVARTRAWRDEVDRRALAAQPDTLEGTSTAPLPPECRRGRILSVDLPERLRPIPLPLRIPVRIENPTQCTWPALGVRPEGLVGLTYRWTSPSGIAGRTERVSRLLADVAPGAVVDTALMVTPPTGEPGPWRIAIRLEQEGVAEPLAEVSRTVELRAAPAGAARGRRAG